MSHPVGSEWRRRGCSSCMDAVSDVSSVVDAKLVGADEPMETVEAVVWCEEDVDMVGEGEVISAGERGRGVASRSSLAPPVCVFDGDDVAAGEMVCAEDDACAEVASSQ